LYADSIDDLQGQKAGLFAAWATMKWDLDFDLGTLFVRFSIRRMVGFCRG
jgi:hypothetical protein